MSRVTAPHWPDGTPKSQGNAFNWRTGEESCMVPRTMAEKVFTASQLKLMKPISATGFRANGGTIVGLSDAADERIAAHTKPGQPLPITASPWNGSKVKPPHAGAFSRAGTQGGDAKIHKPASKARKAAA